MTTLHRDHRATGTGADLVADPDVVLLGGFGMADRHLRKYEQLYRRLGVHDVHLRSPGVLHGTIPRRCDAYARRLVAQLTALERPLVLHVFSGAVWIYYALNHFADEALRRRILGVVFESTPLDVTPEQFGRFTAWRLGRRFHRGWSRPFVLYRWLVGISPDWEADNVRRMLSLPAHLQILGIYADDDPVADSGFITHYFNALLRQGHRVRTLRLESARHCLAIRDHCERYCESLAWLLSDVSLPASAPRPDAAALAPSRPPQATPEPHANHAPDMAHLLAACGLGAGDRRPTAG